jgi:DNA-binding MarR family transcriptional regulator
MDPKGDTPSDDAIEVGRLLVELIHVVYATRDVDPGTEPDAPGGRPDGHGAEPDPHGAEPDMHGVEREPHRGAPRSRPPVSAHAIRAAMHIGHHGTRTIGELAEGLGISIGWASRVVSELEASAMVVRTPDRVDRRIVHVSLTPEASAVVERAYLWRAEAIERALASLDPAGRAAVRTFLRHAVDELPRARLNP